MSGRGAAASAAPIVIEDVTPLVDGGAYPTKATSGEMLEISAAVYAFGHEHVRAFLRSRVEGARGWDIQPMTPDGEDRFRTAFRAGETGRYELEVLGELDPLGRWRSDAARRLGAGIFDENDTVEGAQLLNAAVARLRRRDLEGAAILAVVAHAVTAADATGLGAALAELRHLESLLGSIPPAASRPRAAARIALEVARPLAGCSAWYEVFPRSCSPKEGVHGTFADLGARLDYIAGLGFDVVYLPPIHPIGTTARKGPGNSPVSGPDDPGSPWAIGSPKGGHTAVHPSLGTLADFDKVLRKAKGLELEIALDLAFQCSPDHPWVAEHPEWFSHRPDGSIACAENPPKRYEDVYPLDLTSDRRGEIFAALLDVTLFWVKRGVRIFRVDNPHTKPFALWEWLIAEVRAVDPEVIFLAEAFTRPGPLARLAKVGFDQSYTYFTWRNTKEELTDYLSELAHGEARHYLRPNLWPNTPDILAHSLQHGGRASFVTRLVLAACGAANYGIYGPVFELLVDAPLAPGSEEYAHSEKYELGHFDLDAPHSIAPVIARINAARRAHAALRSNASLAFHEIDNRALICFSKIDLETDDRVLCVVNLDPEWPQSGFVEIDGAALGLADGTTLELTDMLDDRTYRWAERRNYLFLDPERDNAHVFSVREVPAK
jgi:starch synthase (maltosyl-transferring)